MAALGKALRLSAWLIAALVAAGTAEAADWNDNFLRGSLGSTGTRCNGMA